MLFIKSSTIFVILFIATWTAQTSFGQNPTPSPTPTTEEIRLQEEIRLLTLQKQKSDLEKGLRDNVPKATITPLTGSTEFKDSEKPSMEVMMQSYTAMKRVTDNITCDIRMAKATDGTFTIVLYKAEDYAAWRNFNLISPTLKSQLDGMKREYRAWLTTAQTVDFRTQAQITNGTNLEKKIDINGAAAGGNDGQGAIGAFTSVATTALAGISDTVKSFAELMSLFRSDVSFTNNDVVLNPESLKSSISRSFRDTQTQTAPNCLNQSLVTIFDPANFAPAAAPGGAFTSTVLTDINEPC